MLTSWDIIFIYRITRKLQRFDMLTSWDIIFIYRITRKLQRCLEKRFSISFFFQRTRLITHSNHRELDEKTVGFLVNDASLHFWYIAWWYRHSIILLRLNFSA